jgi:hypothetical protein
MQAPSDQVVDAHGLGAKLYAVLRRYDPPELVKQAEAERVLERANLPLHCYADRGHRRLALDSGAATWLSAAFYLTKQAEYTGAQQSTIEGRLAEAAANWGVLGDVEKLAAAVGRDQLDDLAARPDGDFADVAVAGDGAKERHLPLRSAGEVKAAVWFGRHRDTFAYAERTTLARWERPGAISVHGRGITWT